MKYFAYGMNTNRAEMASRCPGARLIGPARIHGYDFVFRTHADIAQNWEGVCHGVLWDIEPGDLKSLDQLEGYPYYYTRFCVRVDLGDHFVYALTYQMTDQTYIQEPSRGYLEMVREGYEQNAVPADQIDRAINMVCSMSNSMNAEYPCTWLPTIKDFV